MNREAWHLIRGLMNRCDPEAYPRALALALLGAAAILFERCEIENLAQVKSGALFAAYREFCERAAER
jgi:hypothetical protein